MAFKMYRAIVVICTLVNIASFAMDGATQDQWWGFKLRGWVSQSAIESAGVVRLQFESKEKLGGEIRAPQVYLFCNKEYEDELLNLITIKAKELFINDKQIPNDSQNLEIGTRNLCALINSVELEEFRKRSLFQPQFSFTNDMDLFENSYQLIKFIKEQRKNLIQERTVLSDNKSQHMWKLPQTIDILVFGHPYVVYAVSFGDNGGRYPSMPTNQSVDQILDEEEKIFNWGLEAFEGDMYLTKTEPKSNKLKLQGSLRGFNGPKKSPYLSIDCQRCFEHTYLNLHLKSR